MSVVVCYYTDTFSIIVTDTRVVYKNGREIVGYNDEANKLYKTKLGWLSAAGLEYFIDLFREIMNQLKIGKISEMKNVFQKAYQATCNDVDIDASEINKTVIVFSYGIEDNNKIALNIGQFSKDSNFGEIATLLKGKLYIIWPSDINEDMQLWIYEKYASIVDGLDDAEKVTYFVSKVIKDISQLSETVSSCCDIGYLLLAGDRFETFNIREQSDVIINSFENDFSAHVDTVN